ncbi:MAG: hypothetical protein OSA51_07825 [Octadecabacter sp.]|nr:hypothetical protein [Octadecabacter sp.]
MSKIGIRPEDVQIDTLSSARDGKDLNHLAAIVDLYARHNIHHSV